MQQPYSRQYNTQLDERSQPANCIYHYLKQIMQKCEQNDHSMSAAGLK